MTTPNEYIQTLISQLPRGWQLMTGAHLISFDNERNALSFRIKGCPDWNHVEIEYLAGADEYEITLRKLSKIGIKATEEITGLYADDLRETLERYTGLAWTVPTIRKI